MRQIRVIGNIDRRALDCLIRANEKSAFIERSHE